MSDSRMGTAAYITWLILLLHPYLVVAQQSADCEQNNCTSTQVCTQWQNQATKCVERKPSLKYCVDMPCGLGRLCQDGELGFQCVPLYDGSKGQCWSTFCRPGTVCMQEEGQLARCVSTMQAPRCEQWNEDYSDCGAGCEATCDDFNPKCDEYVCNGGCRCKKGFVRIGERCAHISSCPKNDTCNTTEQYVDCMPKCEQTCRGIDKCNETATECVAGCVCRDGFRRDADGVCVPNNRCFKNPGCEVNEVWGDCHACESTCGPTKKLCTMFCYKGCVCSDNYIREQNSTCVPKASCAVQNNYYVMKW